MGRLQKQISFSEHEKDIYDYLSSQKNASAFVKRLILNHMIENQDKPKPKKSKKRVETPVEIPKETPAETKKTTPVTPVIEPVKQEEVDANWQIAQDLDL